jgi:hypothetical protein
MLLLPRRYPALAFRDLMLYNKKVMRSPLTSRIDGGLAVTRANTFGGGTAAPCLAREIEV